MRLGVMMFQTDKAIDPVTLAKATEERGFGSLWFPEHSHIPSSRITPWGGRQGAPPLPEEYWRTYDQFVALMAAAAATTDLQVATGITLVAQRDPLWLAKEVATLDALSGGRFVFGIGYGWNKEEMANHGLPYLERRAVLRENMLACKAIWANEEFSFSGEHVNIEPSWGWPKPAQDPHPPILMGGAPGPKTIADMAEFCDGWMPIHGRYDVLENLPKVRAAFEVAGRGDVFRWGVFAAPADADQLHKLADAGAEWLVLGLPPAPADTVLPLLDSYAKLAPDLLSVS